MRFCNSLFFPLEKKSGARNLYKMWLKPVLLIFSFIIYIKVFLNPDADMYKCVYALGWESSLCNELLRVISVIGFHQLILGAVIPTRLQLLDEAWVIVAVRSAAGGEKGLKCGSRSTLIPLQPASMFWRCSQMMLDPFQEQNSTTAGPNYSNYSVSTSTNGQFSHLALWFNDLVI